MARLFTVTWEETGSELVALVTEQENIRREKPALNVAKEVHARRPREGSIVLFLPGEKEGEVLLLFVQDGVPAGRAETDVRARGMRKVRAALRAAFFSDAPPPIRGEDAELMWTWLSRTADTANWLDVTEVRGQAEAARRVKAYLTDPDLFTRKVYHR
jgi:hypothetical protein